MSSSGRRDPSKRDSKPSSRSGSRPSALTTLPRDFSEFLKSLNDHEVRYLVIDGYAVAFHGHPRTTKDLDIWIGVDAKNLDRAVQALREFGFDLPQLTSEFLATPGKIIRMGVTPMRIELFNDIPGVSFEACHPRRMTCAIDGVDVAVIARDDLCANKAASGRPQDLADLEALQ